METHSFRTENKLKEYENVCKSHDYCYTEMPKKDKDILNYNYGEKSMKAPFIIYADMESLLEKMTMILHSKNIINYKIIIITPANIETLLIIFFNLRQKAPKQTPVVFHNGYKYDYLFIIKELAKEFEG